ncbi:MAG: DUF4176 domain-containing protein [Clostridiales bacterium]|nr:DUF4176 domain-containing protein [Clostridiales bacterium]
MFEHLLPLGSVVLLKGGIRKLMVIGLKQVLDDGSGEAFDYAGVLYPEGFLGAGENILFNHEDIEGVVFTGFDSPERVEFLSFIAEAYEKLITGAMDAGTPDGG